MPGHSPTRASGRIRRAGDESQCKQNAKQTVRDNSPRWRFPVPTYANRWNRFPEPARRTPGESTQQPGITKNPDQPVINYRAHSHLAASISCTFRPSASSAAMRPSDGDRPSIVATRRALICGRRAGSITSAGTRRPVAHRADVERQPRSARGSQEYHRAAVGDLVPHLGQRTKRQPLQPAAVRWQPGGQYAVALDQPVASAQELKRRRFRCGTRPPRSNGSTPMPPFSSSPASPAATAWRIGTTGGRRTTCAG